MTTQDGTVLETTEYLPFGSSRTQSGAVQSSYKYTDQEVDAETGLYNYDARLYDPVIGRFITADSIVPRPFDPQSLNRYSYCANNPLIYIDPTGHYDEDYGSWDDGLDTGMDGDSSDSAGGDYGHWSDGLTGKELEQMFPGDGLDLSGGDYGHWSDGLSRKELKDIIGKKLREGNIEEVIEEITDPTLRSCIQQRLERGLYEGVMNCGPRELGFNMSYFSGLAKSPIANLCVKNPNISSVYAEVAVHEWAHSCGWNHGDGKGVPGDEGVLETK